MLAWFFIHLNFVSLVTSDVSGCTRQWPVSQLARVTHTAKEVSLISATKLASSLRPRYKIKETTGTAETRTYGFFRTWFCRSWHCSWSCTCRFLFQSHCIGRCADSVSLLCSPRQSSWLKRKQLCQSFFLASPCQKHSLYNYNQTPQTNKHTKKKRKNDNSIQILSSRKPYPDVT